MRVKLNKEALEKADIWAYKSHYDEVLTPIYEDSLGGIYGFSFLEFQEPSYFHKDVLIFLDDEPETKSQTGWSTSYYELPEGAKELQDIIEHKKMNFAVGNIFKAAYRLGEKEGTSAEYDLNKIIWFAQRELERIKK